MNETLTHVINTLNLIDVRGKDNLNKLLGCILVLEKLISESNSAPEMPINPDGE